MACDDADTTADALASAAASPRRVSGDAGSVESQPISDLIALEQYQRSKCASTKASLGIRIRRLIPPGTV